MALCINDSGSWREITTQCVNDSGTWRNVATGCINDSGTWRQFGFTPALGSAYEGGFLICQSTGVNWIVAPNTTEVSRCWNCRDDAVTTAESNAACGDWFVPTIGQLQNPGYCCRTNWDSYSSAGYWSSTPYFSNLACCVNFANGSANYQTFAVTLCVRAFRCVAY